MAHSTAKASMVGFPSCTTIGGSPGWQGGCFDGFFAWSPNRTTANLCQNVTSDPPLCNARGNASIFFGAAWAAGVNDGRNEPVF
jgi:hypothetical protein